MSVLFLATNSLSLYRSSDIDAKSLDLDGYILADSLSLDRSAPLIVYVWGSWCPVCKTTTPNIEFLAKYLNVVTIATKSDGFDRYAFETIDDSNGRIAKELNVSVFPTIIVYDKNGKAFFVDVGYTSTLSIAIKYMLAKVLP